MTTNLDGWTAGTWEIDPAHSGLQFQIRHLAISKVRGSFERFSGEIVTGETPEQSRVRAEIETDSVTTGNADRDAHLRGGDFFDVEAHPRATFVSTAVRPSGDGFLVEGELTIKGVTKPIAIEAEFGGIADDAYGSRRLGLEGELTLDRREFELGFNVPDATGGLVLGNDVKLSLEIQAVLQK
ncbi:MAG: YceI family protein [Pseudoclavibacter sp.]|nr:YceI family protein [Pseudoclavibacter sp.]